MESIDITNAKAWDDSALLNSWNVALAEYKKYHSLHPNSINIEDVLDEHEEKKSALEPTTTVQMLDRTDVERTRREITAQNILKHEILNGPQINDDNEAYMQACEKCEANSSPKHSTPMPPGILLEKTGYDEATKNLMMSWYYAGYYTGYAEGLSVARQKHSKY